MQPKPVDGLCLRSKIAGAARMFEGLCGCTDGNRSDICGTSLEAVGGAYKSLLIAFSQRISQFLDAFGRIFEVDFNDFPKEFRRIALAERAERVDCL